MVADRKMWCVPNRRREVASPLLRIGAGMENYLVSKPSMGGSRYDEVIKVLDIRN